MVRLEQLTPGASVRGLVAGTTVKVVQVEWFGDQAVKVTFEEPNGAVRNRLVYRSDEAFARAGRGGAGMVVPAATASCSASPPKPNAFGSPICSIPTWRCRPR